ncbi:MAG: arginine--tRNA ligase [Rhodospirillaceae bacterium]|jgi:arginyl-tRNA synthetase|nr:arginine--tRNA ligase [Rhodospirillaceae bacterium]
MNLFKIFRADIINTAINLVKQNKLPPCLDYSKVTAEPPREAIHGDISTNIAMVLANVIGMKPQNIAEMLIVDLRNLPWIASIEVAKQGFINLRLTNDFWYEQLVNLLRSGIHYGDSNFGCGIKVNIEYVSANPTGPMHIGHARGAVFGDVLARLLEKVGYDVVREYYINDAGIQIDILARSTYLRYREALGETIGEIPEGFYPGEYLIPVGQAIAIKDGTMWRNVNEDHWLSEFRSIAIDAMMKLIHDDLAMIGVQHTVFTSERELIDSGKVNDAFHFLYNQDLIYQGALEQPKGKVSEDWEPRTQTLFRATKFGDDIDRPLKKSDGSWTYFASDIAYHFDKCCRGFSQIINVWGSDHDGYIKRIKAIVKAIAGDDVSLDVKLCQMVNFLKNGVPYKMSKRSGTFVTMRDVVNEVGKDVIRFIMLTRKNDAQLDFDLVKVLEQSRDNQIFYVQYAHARAHSVLRHGIEMFPNIDCSQDSLVNASFYRLSDPFELILIRLISKWPFLVENAARAHEPHRIAFYLYDVAAAFHELWNKGKDDATLRFLIEKDKELSFSRLALVRAVALLIASGLAIFGVEPVEEMR